MIKLKKLYFILIFILFINISYANILFDDISLVNNSIINETNIQIDIILLNNGTSDNYQEIISPRTNAGNYADLMLNADDKTAQKYCEESYDNTMLKYESSVNGNLYAKYDGVNWDTSRDWNSNKITKIYCNSKSSDIELYYNLDNIGDVLISSNKLVNSIQLDNLPINTHNITFYAKDDLSNISKLYFFDIASTSTSCLLPNGNYLNSAENITLYEKEVVSYGTSCNSEVRFCTNGILSGNFTYSSCVNDIEKDQLKFWDISLENNTLVIGMNLTINFTLVNENFYLINSPIRDTLDYKQLRVYGEDNISATRICLEQFNSTFYNYTTISRNHIYSYWNGSSWEVELNPKYAKSLDKLYCIGYNNQANLYYSFDGGDYILFSSNLTYTNLELFNLYYKHHTIQFFANYSEDNYVYSDIIKFANNVSIPDEFKDLPGLLNNENNVENIDESFFNTVLNWFENLFI